VGDTRVEKMESEMIQKIEDNPHRIDEQIEGHAGEKGHSREDIRTPEGISMVDSEVVKPELPEDHALADDVAEVRGGEHLVEKGYIPI